jgi:hypothetical protein
MKKFLLRVDDNKFKTLKQLAETESINNYINKIIDNHLKNEGKEVINMETINISDLKISETKEMITVTQNKWFMELLLKYKIHFFTPTRIVKPMQYILFYQDSTCTIGKCIKYIGHITKIYRYINKDQIKNIEEIKLLDDNFSKEILKWSDEKNYLYQIAIIDKLTELKNPLPLGKNYTYHPRIMVNKKTTINKLLEASIIDDLFLDRNI